MPGGRGYDQVMATLYLPMTEAVINHWKANNNAYPQKFILSPAQHKAYIESRRAGIGGPDADGSVHSGVPVEISEDTPGVLIAIDGTEISLS